MKIRDIFLCVNPPILKERSLGDIEFGRKISKSLNKDCLYQKSNSNFPKQFVLEDSLAIST